ncbi:MAG: hypothetical protein R2806_20525 [Saprospiraceae bacterium]
MESLIKKLNYKDQPIVHFRQVPSECRELVKTWTNKTTVVEDLPLPASPGFLVAFIYDAGQLKELAKELGRIDLASDPVIWFAYPKKSSRNYQTDITRDHGWQPVGDLGLEPVRQVAIDEDWSALRFRAVQSIKTMKRSSALTEAGKKRINKD